MPFSTARWSPRGRDGEAEPRIYEILLGRYGLDPAETLFIDDRPANVAAAEALGIRGFGFDHRDPAAACDALRRMLL